MLVLSQDITTMKRPLIVSGVQVTLTSIGKQVASLSLTVTPDLRTTKYTLAGLPRGKLPDHDDIQTVKARVVVLTTTGVAGQTQARFMLSCEMRARLFRPCPTSGIQIAAPAPTAPFQHSGATTALSTEQTEMNPAALATQAHALPLMTRAFRVLVEFTK